MNALRNVWVVEEENTYLLEDNLVVSRLSMYTISFFALLKGYSEEVSFMTLWIKKIGLGIFSIWGTLKNSKTMKI